MDFLANFIKVFIFALIEGITEWLPVSSTGHLILSGKLLNPQFSPKFFELFLIIVQLGAVLAVVVIYWSKLWPFATSKTSKLGFTSKKEQFQLWSKVIVASLPAGIIGVAFDDVFDRLFYNYPTVLVMLVLVGLLFLYVETPKHRPVTKIHSMVELSYRTAFLIGWFQLVAAILPGTSRSGATIIGALLLGVSRNLATEFTFYLAIPAMAGAGLLKLLKLGLNFSVAELFLLGLGFILAFVISLGVIRFLVRYVRSHDFRIFGYYRIALALLFSMIIYAV